MYHKEATSLIKQLGITLSRVREAAGQDFSGVGVILYADATNLPICPLSPTGYQLERGNLIETLAKIASIHSEFHDGFHLINEDWRLTQVAQYFSPPIIQNAKIDRTKHFGGRYLAAQFGSALPGVILCGVASNGFGLAIFQSGVEVHFEEFR